MFRIFGNGPAKTVMDYLRSALKFTTRTEKAKQTQETTEDQSTNTPAGRQQESNLNTHHSDLRYPRQGPKFVKHEKVLCFTEDSPYEHYRNQWQSPNSVFLGNIVGYSKTTGDYYVKINDWNPDQSGKIVKMGERYMISWEKHCSALNCWGL